MVGVAEEEKEKEEGGGRSCQKPPPHCCDLFLALFALGHLDYWIFWEMTSTMFLYSTLSLVRRWIHAHAPVHVAFGRFLAS